nr:hypothetical protein GCM10025732_30660 [Glycomyces mayteni]
MLAHLHGRDRVETGGGDVAVVAQAEVDPVGEAAFGGAGGREAVLLGREGHGRDARSVVLGGVHGQCAPAASNVEQARARCEAELAADEVELVALGVRKRVGGRLGGPVPARVDHRGVEDEFVELVGEVVVEADDLLVAALGVQAPGDGVFEPGGVGSAADELVAQGERQGGHGGAEAGGGAGRGGGAVDAAQAVGEVAVHVDLTEDVRLGEPELAGTPQEPAERVGAVEAQERAAVVRSGLAAVPGAQPDRRDGAGGFGGQVVQLSGECHRHASRMSWRTSR